MRASDEIGTPEWFVKMISVEKLVELLATLDDDNQISANTRGQTGNLAVIDARGTLIGWLDMADEIFVPAEAS